MSSILMEDIHPLSEFVRNAKTHIGEINDSGRAQILTVNGKAEVAVLGKKLFDELIQAREQLETLRAIQSGLEDIEAGRLRSAEEVHKELLAL